MSGPGPRRNLAPLAFGREIRRRRGVSWPHARATRERSGLTPNYIGTVENGQRDPSLSTVFALAKGLGISPGELFGATGELSPASTEAATLIATLNPELQNAVLELLRAVSRRRRRE